MNKLQEKLKAIQDSVEKWKKDAEFFMPQHIRKERFDLCQNCQFFMKSTTICKRCGCVMKWKINFPNVRCPEGKWREYEQT